MQMTIDFQSAENPGRSLKRPVERVVMQPWLNPNEPWWWRQRQLHRAADEVAASLIIYRSGEYGPSLLRARKAADQFYKQHEAALAAA